MGIVSIPAQTVMEGIADGTIRRPQTAWHCILEFYSVSTRLPSEFRLSVGDALRLVREEILGRFEVRQLPKHAFRAFLETVAHEGVGGGRVYDAHIAEVARLSGAKLVVTDNRRHFTILLRYGMRVVDAAAFRDEFLLRRAAPRAR